MNVNLEIEYKMLISETFFIELNNHYSQYETVMQVNTYFDRLEQPLHLNGFGMRIRNLEGKHTLTLKQKCEDGIQEYEIPLPSSHIKELQDVSVQALLKKVELGGTFFKKGQLTTWRKEVPLKHGVLCIDKSSYSKETDYEIEFEVYEDAQAGYEEFMQLLSSFQQIYVSNPTSKMHRCFEAL